MLSFLLSICDPIYHDKIEMLVNTYHDQMIIYAKSILKKANDPNYEYDAEEVVQNLYMRIVKYCASVRFHESPAVLKGYLKKILKNEAMTFLKDMEYLESLDDKEYLSIDDESFFTAVQAKEKYNAVLEAIDRLKDIYSYSLSFRYCDEMEIPDIANLMGVAEKTVYTRIERGKKLLLDALAKEGSENVFIYK